MPDRKPPRRRLAAQGSRSQFQPQGARTSRVRVIDDKEVFVRFLIVCEGEKTEPKYFGSFRVPGLLVDAVGTGHNTLSLVDEAIRLKREKEMKVGKKGKLPYDQVWCIFDRDSFPADDFNNAIGKARTAGFQVAYTNEAFELWYLLHFDDHRSALKRSQYKEILHSCLGHTYHKNSETMYHELQNLQTQAIRRAESLLAEYGSAHNPQEDNPSTTVHLLVKALNANISPRTDPQAK